jgi:hypothetical protein
MYFPSWRWRVDCERTTRQSAYSKNVLDVDCHIQGRLKLMIELYFSEKSVINSKYLITAPSYFSW